MIHNKFILWAAAALLTLTTACTETDMLKADVPQESAKPHTYRLSIDMPVPSHDGQTTRANTEWEDGSQVEFKFYTKEARDFHPGTHVAWHKYYYYVMGIATFNALKNEWLLKLEKNSPLVSVEEGEVYKDLDDCEVRYYQPQSDTDSEFLTAVYYGATTYSFDDSGEEILCSSISLKPTNWKLRFKGEIGTVMELTSNDIERDYGEPLYEGSLAISWTSEIDTIPLTVAADGYTPYIYGIFKNEEGDNTITVETGGHKYSRTISGTALQPGETGYIVIPTESNYEVEGWTKEVDDCQYAFDTEELQFSSEESFQKFKVLSNSQWYLFAGYRMGIKYGNDPVVYELIECDWITLSEESGENECEITVTVAANPTTKERSTTIWLYDSDILYAAIPVCSLEVKQSGKSNDVEEVVVEAVDLGLPSGLLWANMNVGATAPEDYGDYFAWGETEPKSTYNWSTYKYCNGSGSTLTKYCTSSSYGTVDNKATLEAADDAATVNWGGKWRMPTIQEQWELLNKCIWKDTIQNNVEGFCVIGNNGNSIFLPATGYFSSTNQEETGDFGWYWSSSLHPSLSINACYLEIYMGGRYNLIPNYYWNSNSRECGRSVRPVQGNVLDGNHQPGEFDNITP